MTTKLFPLALVVDYWMRRVGIEMHENLDKRPLVNYNKFPISLSRFQTT